MRGKRRPVSTLRRAWRASATRRCWLTWTPRAIAASGLPCPRNRSRRTIFDALIEERDGRVAKIGQIVWQIASNFDLVPSNIHLAGFEQLFAGRPGREERLDKALATVRDTYEWCIIDCPPSVGLLTFNALRACDEVIVPVETGFFSLHGLARMMETLELMREQCSRDIQVRVLPTQYDTRTKLAREVLSELRGKFRDYLMESTINFNTKLKEAASFGQPITEYDPGSRGYKDFVNLARELMGHRPVDVEPMSSEKLSRPAELVQRARQLAQLTAAQFGRTATAPTQAAFSAVEIAEDEPIAEPEAPVTLADDEVRVPAPVGRLADETSDVAEEARDLAVEQKILDFYGVKQIGRRVVFAARFETANRVAIAGDFNNWSPDAALMQGAGRSGEWRMELPLGAGRYRYRLVVDGKWITDPNNTYVEANQFGELNNVVEVE